MSGNECIESTEMKICEFDVPRRNEAANYPQL